MNVLQVIPGDGPVVLGQPHGGTFLPDGVASRLNRRGRGLADTDWQIARLYDGLLAGAAIVRTNIHRYVIDANRDPSGASLYPGQNTTGLCPTTDFDGREIWRAGQAPSPDEIAARRRAYHAPYHEALAAELARAKARHGVAILFDCHSIRSVIPFLFKGRLPVFSIGTHCGASCAPEIEAAVLRICTHHDPANAVLNGRFKGGWSTRHHGRPDAGVHTIQLELAQRAYMDEAAPWTYRPGRAAALRAVLRDILSSLDERARSGAMNH